MSNRQGYKNTEIEELPEDWKVAELGQIVTRLENGLTYAPSPSRKGVPITRIETISNGKIDPEKVGFVERLSTDVIDRHRLVAGDILFSHINSVQHIGKTAMYHGDPSVLLHGMNLLLIRPINTRADPFFLGYFLQHETTRNRLRSLAKKAVNQASINTSELRSFKVPLPDLREQRKIASILSTADDAIQKTDEIIAKTQQLKKGLMQQLLTKGIGHTKFKQTEIGEIPEEWKLAPGRDLFSLVGGYPPAALSFEESNDNDIPYVKVDDLNDPRNQIVVTTSRQTLSRRKNPDLSTCPRGVIVFPKRGAAILTNKVRILGREATFDTNIMGLVCKPRVDASFFRYQLEHLGLYRLLENAGIPQLNNKHLYPFKFKQPDLEEQKRIASILLDFENRLALETRRMSELQNLKRGLMQVLLTGKVRVRVN